MGPQVTSHPASIGRFRIDAVLGSGGMGAVYKAFDPTLQRTVAVKTVRPDMDRPDLLERLLREAQACARLRHRNVVTVFEAGSLDGLVYIVMECLQGEDLGSLLRRGALSFADKIDVLIQVLDALQHSHTEGVIHRDIKPSNVHREPDGCVKVVDFGLARVVEASPLTQTGALMCTPDYASPEQLRDDVLDARTDIYSTGAMAYEMFTGRRPFQGETGSLGALIARALAEPVPPMNVWWSRKFPEVERIVTRAMAKSPADRYQSAGEMRNALSTFLESSRGAIAKAQTELESGDQRTWTDAETLMPAATAATTGTRADALTTAERTSPDADRSRTQRPSRSNGRRRLLAVAVAIVLVAVVIPRLMRRAPDPASTHVNDAATRTATTASDPATSATGPARTKSVAPTGATIRSSADNTAPASTARGVTAVPGASLAPVPAATAASATSSATAPTIEPARDLGAKALFAKSGATGAVNAGLRYRLTRRSPDGTEGDVESTTTFRSGDRVRFSFDSNIDGFLYVVQQGSSGRWTVLFPGPRINDGKNAIQRGEEYQVPSNDWFLFDATPGSEQVFVFLSRDPMAQLPGFDRPVTKPETILASVVDDLRNRITSRDLIFEKDAAPITDAGARSQATYVVNRTELGQAVSASITLSHTP